MSGGLGSDPFLADNGRYAVDLNDKDLWIRYYAGLAMQEAIRNGGFQGGPDAEERAAKQAARIAKVTANAVEQALKFD
jgi:hypothetical protein